MRTHLLALDQGTTSSRALLLDASGQVTAVEQLEFKQIFPQPGWVEHNPIEIWSTQSGAVAEVISESGIRREDVAAIGITNQRETTIVWERETGRPIYNAIVWQDRRTSDYCNALKEAGKADMIRERTGLVIDAYFSATKVRWMLDHVPGVKELAKEGK